MWRGIRFGVFMASINTNFTAGLALRGLSYSQAQIAKAQDRISTGYRVQEAKDDAAYWSIATTMGSDSKAMSAVQDALALGSATAGVAYAAINTTLKLVNQMKEKLIAAREPGIDLAKIQSDISGLQGQMLSTVASANFSGENWLTIDSTSGADVKKSIVSSYGRSDATTISVGTIELKIYDATTGDTIALVDTNTDAAAKRGLLDRMRTTASGAQWQVAGVNISQFDHSPVGLAELDSIITGLDETVSDMTAAATELGSKKARFDLQRSFMGDLMKATALGVSQLIDADMNHESTRLRAMQTRESLGIQSLSIANTSAKAILGLFQ